MSKLNKNDNDANERERLKRSTKTDQKEVFHQNYPAAKDRTKKAALDNAETMQTKHFKEGGGLSKAMGAERYEQRRSDETGLQNGEDAATKIMAVDAGIRM